MAEITAFPGSRQPVEPDQETGAGQLTTILTGVVEDVWPRGPGRPRGMGRTPGSGRKKGTKNRRTVEVEAVMDKMLPRARKALAKLLDSEEEETALKAATIVLAYRFGKPVDRREVSGPDGGPIARTTVEASQKLIDEAAEQKSRAILTALHELKIQNGEPGFLPEGTS